MEKMDLKTRAVFGAIIAFGGGLVILVLGLLFDYIKLNPYSSEFWMIFLVLIVYFALGAQKKNILPMIVSFACGLVWGFISNMTAFLFIQSNHVLFAVLNYFLIAGLIVYIHQFLTQGTVFGLAPCAFLGLAESICFATCALPNAQGELMKPMTWGPVDLFIIYLIGMVMVTGIAFFTEFLAGLFMKKKMKAAQEQHHN